MSIKGRLDKLEEARGVDALPWLTLTQGLPGDYDAQCFHDVKGKVWTIEEARAAGASCNLILVTYTGQPDLLGDDYGRRVDLDWGDEK